MGLASGLPCCTLGGWPLLAGAAPPGPPGPRREPVRVTDALIRDVGLLTQVRPKEVDFPFRVMAEHLAGREIWEGSKKENGGKGFGGLCQQRWAEEPLRFAILWAKSQHGNARAAELIDSMLEGEEVDKPESEPVLSDEHLRALLIALTRGQRSSPHQNEKPRSSRGTGKTPPGQTRSLRMPRRRMPISRSLHHPARGNDPESA